MSEVGPRHGRLRQSAAWRTVLAVVGGTLAVALAASGSVAAIALYQLQSNIDTERIEADSIAPLTNVAEYDGGFNILLVGSDTRDGQNGIGGDETSELNDVTMLLHVAQDQRSATLVSLPRDMVIRISECENGGPGMDSINTALYYGGLNCAVKTVQDLTGLEIQFAGLITFVGVIEMSNAVGGVEVCTDGPINDRYTGLNLPSAGSWTLVGGSALAFLRSRHGVGDGSDLGRIGSQQVFLSSLVRKIKSDGTLNDYGRLYSIAQAATQNITLSENFARLDTLVSIALVLRNIPLENIAMVQYPSRIGTSGIYAGKVEPIEEQAEALFAAIRADLPIALDAEALDGSHGGSAPDPNAPDPTESPTPEPTESAEPSPDPDAGPQPVVIEGVKGQNAAQYTCAVAN
jgi:LCP family protein required for cell wall assembly